MHSKLVVVAVLTALAAAAVVGGRATGAKAYIPGPAPDAGISAGGYTLIDPAAPNVEANRARFDFALRHSQVTGQVYGKSLTIRSWGVFGPCVPAVDGSGWCGNKYVVRMWTLTPYPGIPPYPGDGALVTPCAFNVDTVSDGDAHMFAGRANIFTVDGGGLEHPTGIQFGLEVHVVVGPDATPLLDGIYMTADAPIPVALPGDERLYGPRRPQPLIAGNVGVREGVLAPACW